MIRSWKQVAMKSIRQNRLVRLFHAKEMSNYLERAYVLKMMEEDSSDLSEEEVKQKFLRLVAKNEGDRKIEEDRYSNLENFALNHGWPKDDIDVHVTDKEISYINGIQAPREFRLFVLGAIIYGKFTYARYGIPLLNNLDRSFVYYMVTGRDDYALNKERDRSISSYWNSPGCEHGFTFTPRISKIQEENGRVKNRTNIMAVADWVDYEASDGHLIHDYYRDPLILSKKIEPWVKTCPQCGKAYVVGNKDKTTLCHDCYRETRKKQECERVKQQKNRKKTF